MDDSELQTSAWVRTLVDVDTYGGTRLPAGAFGLVRDRLGDGRYEVDVSMRHERKGGGFDNDRVEMRREELEAFRPPWAPDD